MKAPEGKIQEVVELPHDTLKPNSVCVIASGEIALKAKNAGADRVVERGDLEDLNGKKKELRQLGNKYDVFISEAPLMPLVGRILGPVLGPRGKMPVPVAPNADIVALINKHQKLWLLECATNRLFKFQSAHADERRRSYRQC